MDNTDQAQDEFADTFNGKADEAASGYGINPMQADSDAMAEAFDSPDVEVGQPMSAAAIESKPLPDMPDEAQSSQAPAEMEAKSAEPAERPVAMPEFKTFGQAFKWHREQAANGGPSTFDWNGKKFTTQLKSEAKPAKAAAKPAKTKPATEAEKFEREFVSRDQPPANPVDRSKTLAFREAAASQPVNLNEDPTRIKTADEIAAGVVRAGKAAPSAPAPKDGRPWYQAGPKNTFIREGDDPKGGPIYGSKPASGKPVNPRADDLYRGKGTNQGEMS